LLTPILIFGNKYYVGGDDTRLYYLFPDHFLKSFAVNIISDNALGGANTGYNSAAHFIPFLIFIKFLKTLLPFLNTQYLMYGLNYSFAFIAFFLFISIWIKGKSITVFFIKIIASLFFVWSPFLATSLYVHQLPSIYLVSLMPAILYFFSRAVLEKKYSYSVVSIVLFSVLSTTLNTLPWSLPILITGVPLFIYLFIKDKRSFVVNILILFFLGVLLNVFWLFHFVYSNLSNSGIASSAEYYSTDEYNRANIQGIMNLSRILNPLVPIILKKDFRFLENFNLVDLRNVIFIFVITFSSFWINAKKSRPVKSILWVSISGLLLSWFLFSPNFSDWGPNYFLKFVTTFPYGIMFRNMYDKFALPLAFYFAYTLSLSLFLVNKNLKNRYVKHSFLLLIFVVVLSNSKFFFLKPITEDVGDRGFVSGTFNKDFNDLVGFLEAQDNASRILWIPMTAPNYVVVEDGKLSGQFYSGLSPLRILANRSDYVGRYSFLLPGDVFYGDKIFKLVQERDYENFAKELQKLNVRYLVYNKQDIPEEMKDYIYDQDRKYLNLQDDKFKNYVFGRKIRNFGEHYTLYEINDEFLNDKLYVTPDVQKFLSVFTDLEYSKEASYLYQVKIMNLKSPTNLVFLEPYYKDWVLYVSNGEVILPYKKGENFLVHDWANAWEIDPKEIKEIFDRSFYKTNGDGSIEINLSLYFEPQKFNKKLYFTSISAYLASGLLLLINGIKILHEKKKLR